MHHVDADTDESGARSDHGGGEEVSQHEVVVLSNLLATMQWHDSIINISNLIQGGPSVWIARLGLIGLIGTGRAGGQDGGTSKTKVDKTRLAKQMDHPAQTKGCGIRLFPNF